MASAHIVNFTWAIEPFYDARGCVALHCETPQWSTFFIFR